MNLSLIFVDKTPRKFSRKKLNGLVLVPTSSDPLLWGVRKTPKGVNDSRKPPLSRVFVWIYLYAKGRCSSVNAV